MIITKRGLTIGIDGSRAFTSNRTGVENYAFELLKHFALIDKQNHYLIYLRPGNVIHKADWPENFEFKLLNLPRLWTQVGLASQTFKDPLDVLFVPGHTVPLFQRKGLKTVMTVHDLGAEYLPGMHQLKQRIYLRWITQHQLKNATRLIAVSQATRTDLINKAHIQPDKIEVVYEGIDLSNYTKVSNDTVMSTAKQFDIEGRNYFLFVGTIQPRKNLTRLIEAFAKFHKAHPDYYLVLAGSKGWLSEEIFATPKKLGIEHQVKFLGYVSDEQKKALIQGAKAFVFPSLFEGFGLPILEAFALDCPVLTSKLSSMPEVGGKGVILVDPYDIEDISKGMVAVCEKKNKQRLLVEGRKQLQKFSWEKAAKETLVVLTEVAQGVKET